MNSFIVFVLVAFVASVSADPIVVGFEGKCPEVPFVKDFDYSKFKGPWYAMKETGRKIPCIIYDIEETHEHHYQSFVQPKNFTMGFEKKNHEDFADGMIVDFKINPYLDGAILKIFSIDYQSYAGVYACKQASPDLYYQFISFWSRNRNVHYHILKKFEKDILKHEGVDISFMHDVEQSHCDHPL